MASAVKIDWTAPEMEDSYSMQPLRRRGDALHRRLRRANTPFHMTMWGQPVGKARPALLPWWYGDGRKLIGIASIHQRPNYWIIRGDTAWHEDGDERYTHAEHDVIANILWPLVGEIEDAFGQWERYDPDPEQSEYPVWPECDASDGLSWFSLRWQDFGFPAPLPTGDKT